MRAVFLDFGTVSHDDLDTGSLERVLPGITLYPTSSDAEVDERIAGSEFILTNKLNISRARMRAVPGLRFIGLTATGTNNVDLEAARELGIAVCNIRDYCTVSVVQHVLGVVLALTHRLRDYGQAAIDGTWSRSEQFTVPGAPIRELSGKVLGIIGYGTLGRAVAKAARDALECACWSRNARARPRVVSPIPRPRSARYAPASTRSLRSCDVLSLHCPLTPATSGLIGKRELTLMKPEALLINTARGGLVDLDALVAALRGGDLGGAAIDVLPQDRRRTAAPCFHRASESHRHSTHRLGGVRGAAACRRRAGAQYRDFQRGGRRGRVV